MAYAPAPATPAPKEPPAPIATEAAAETARMPAFSVASIVIPPTVVTNFAGPLPARYASTWFAIWLNASEMPIATATPALPPNAAATAAAPAIAEIDEVSDAASEIEFAEAPLVPPPSTNALTCAAMWFSA